jgi:CBS domain-containing protein
MKAVNIMNREVAMIPKSATLEDAARVMWDANCGIVPVIEGETGKLCGVITDRDVCMGALTQGTALHQIPVTTSMSNTVATCREDDDLGVVEDTMRRYRVRRVPVVDAAHRVVGIISIDDLARAALDAQGASGTSLKRNVAKTLGILVSPSHPIERAAQA